MPRVELQTKPIASGDLPSSVINGSRSQGRADLKLDYGAVGDGQIVADGAMDGSTGVLTCATSLPFKVGDVGKNVVVPGAGAAGANLKTTISTFTDSGHVTLAAVSATAVSGAVIAWGTDDTAAIQAAVTAMAAAGGRICMVPDGIYIMAAAVQTGTIFDAQVLFPAVTNTSQPQSIGFEGYTAPFGVPESVKISGSNEALWTGGAIFQSLLTSSAGKFPAVFAADGNASGYEESQNLITFDGLTIRCPPANAMQALNLADAGGCELGVRRGLRVDVLGTYPTIPQPQALGANSLGINGPTVGNWAKCRYGTVDISGYTYGWQPNEHTIAENMNISYCLACIQMRAGYLGVRVNRLCTFDSPHHIMGATTTHPNPLNIGQWAIEDDLGDLSPVWCENIDHLNTSQVSGAVLQGSVESLMHTTEGTGNVSTPITRSVGTGSITFPIAKQFSNATGSVYVIDPASTRQVRVAALASPKSTVGTWTVTQSSAHYSGGVQFNSSNAQNDSITFQEVYLGAGTWTIDLFGPKGSTAAIWTVQLKDQDGNIAASGTVDKYNASTIADRSSITGLVIPNSKLYTVTLLAATRNASSTGWTIQVDDLVLTRTV